MRPALIWFARRMERTLQDNDWKGGWHMEDPRWLLRRLRQETKELTRAVQNGSCEAIVREAADVANFAMMIADQAREQ